MSNTFWHPRLSRGGAPVYQAIADALEHDINEGVLRDGSRLPTHRDLAQTLGVTPLTITRAYKEAARRGLVDSTVGRGTFVRATTIPESTTRRADDPFVDLSKNIVAGSELLDIEPRLLGDLRLLLRDAEYQPTEGMLRHRTAAAKWVRMAGLETTPANIVITPGAQQSIVSILSAVCRPGDTILSEALTYPRLPAVASLLNLQLAGVALDDHGMIVKDFERLCRKLSPRAIYTIPNLQNPTGSVMPEKRRQEIAKIARQHDVVIIEDDVYGFLLDDPPPPISSFAPELGCFITSTSKSLTPSLRLGFAAVPDELVERVTSALGSITAFTSTVAAETFVHFLENGSAEKTIEAKRELVRTNRRAVERAWPDEKLTSHDMTPHLWLTLKECDARELVDRARLRAIGLAPASSFAVERGMTPNAVRLSIGAMTDPRRVETALRAIATLASDPRLGTSTVV